MILIWMILIDGIIIIFIFMGFLWMILIWMILIDGILFIFLFMVFLWMLWYSWVYGINS
ncbi:MAG: hypothetical protein ACTTM0_01055 [Candidatus Karelsulcia muelleri]